VNLMRATLKKHGAPEDLIIAVEESSLEATNELMKQVDLVVATGGGALVKAAYSSGTPSYGVGQGNAAVVVDETADLKDAANKVMRSKTFDLATSCSTENSMVIQESVYDEMLNCLKNEGGYLVNAAEKAKLQAGMWPNGKLSGEIVGQPLEKIAKIAGLTIPTDRKFFMVEETGIGPDYLFSGEKISMVVTLFKYDKFQDAIDMVNAITTYQGEGHSCGIHSFNDDHILELSLQTKTSRVMVRQPQCLSNAGAWTNGMPITVILGCGTWGGNISSDNITWKKLMNITWVSAPIASTQPTDQELFGDLMLAKKE
jgi:sulfoacetaldehyde dehydrogenase